MSFPRQRNTNGQKTRANSMPVVIATDQSPPVAVTGPTLTKGTQSGSTQGLSVQDLSDAGRTRLTYYVNTQDAGTSAVEKIILLVQVSNTTNNGSTGSSGTAGSWRVTNAKRLRIEHMRFACRGDSTATLQNTVFNLRVNTGGAITTSSTIIFAASVATRDISGEPKYRNFHIPGGLEILGDGTLEFGITAAATFAGPTGNAPSWDVTITGFEY